MVLVPLLADFSRLHPAVVVEVMVQDGFTDIVASGFDAGVRFGESLHQDMIAVRLGPEQRGAIVGSPGYLEGRRKPASPHDLHDHVCIRRRFAGGGLYRWEMEKNGEAVDVAVDGCLILNDDRLIIDAALAGAGLAYVFEAQVADDIA
ncbi:LysR family transcriptional regulator, partial [Lactobacillus crispatus]